MLGGSGCAPGFQTFTQQLDHFDSSNTATFQQRYLVSDMYYKPGGPILFIAGFESTLPDYEICSSAAFYPDGFELGAMVVAMEHRYYGNSLPFGAASFAVQNLRYLTIDNAVADYALFLKHFKLNNTQYPIEDAPVFAYGGSYAALLSTLLRIKYPQIVDGAISSAAPIFLYSSGIDGDLYYDTVSESYQRYYPECASRISNAFQALNQSFESGDYAGIMRELKLCSLPGPLSKYELPSILMTAFATIMQYNYPSPGRYPVAWPVAHLCNDSSANSDSWGSPLVQALNLTYNSSSAHVQCFNVGSQLAGEQHATVESYATDATVWMYQCCTEFVQPQSGSGMFSFYHPWDYDGFMKWCQTQYPGSKPNPYPAPLGPYNAPVANFTNVVFANGLFDPIRTFSPSKSLSSSVIALNIEYSAHCEDINIPPYKYTEPAALPQARSQEVAILKQWMEEKKQQQQQQNKKE